MPSTMHRSLREFQAELRAEGYGQGKIKVFGTQTKAHFRSSMWGTGTDLILGTPLDLHSRVRLQWRDWSQYKRPDLFRSEDDE